MDNRLLELINKSQEDQKKRTSEELSNITSGNTSRTYDYLTTTQADENKLITDKLNRYKSGTATKEEQDEVEAAISGQLNLINKSLESDKTGLGRAQYEKRQQQYKGANAGVIITDDVWDNAYRKYRNQGMTNEEAINAANARIEEIENTDIDQSGDIGDTPSTTNESTLDDLFAQLLTQNSQPVPMVEPLQNSNIELSDIEMIAYKAKSDKLWSLRLLPIDQIIEIYEHEYDVAFMTNLMKGKNHAIHQQKSYKQYSPKRKPKRFYSRY